MADIIVYTDGSAKGNPGKGGYGIVIMSGKYRKDISVGYRLTTNNRMELLAVIVALFCAIISWHVVERPAQQLKVRFKHVY